MASSTYRGQCFCGAVKFEVTGAPKEMGYCHCESCRSWSASPLNGFTLWDTKDIAITGGEDQVGEYRKTENSHRRFCRNCGGHLMTYHPEMGLIDVFSAMLPELVFKPELHVHYGEKVLSVLDELPKFADLPAELGGSGVQLTE
ncbi:GFA family protein [Marinobacter salinisoli]|nr:GFA family protein [Marinobacter salinisoli]